MFNQIVVAAVHSPEMASFMAYGPHVVEDAVAAAALASSAYDAQSPIHTAAESFLQREHVAGESDKRTVTIYDNDEFFALEVGLYNLINETRTSGRPRDLVRSVRIATLKRRLESAKQQLRAW